MNLEHKVFSEKPLLKDTNCQTPQECAIWQQYALATEMISIVPGIIYVFNHETQSNEYSNRSIGDLLGYSPEEVIGMGDALFTTIVNPAHLKRLGAYHRDLRDLKTGERSEIEYLCRAKDGSDVWLHSIDAALEIGADGRVRRHVGIATDITAVKEAEQRLTHMNQVLEARVAARTVALSQLNEELETRVAVRTDELQEVVEELSELAYVATHNLKVPIANMCALVTLLSEARSDMPETYHETLDWLVEAGEQARATLDALVQVSVTRDSRLEAPEKVSLKPLLQKVCDQLQQDLNEAHAQISIDAGDITTVRFAPKVLETAFASLIRNAVHYRSVDRPLEISVITSCANGQVYISVADNGRGLDPEKDGAKILGLFKRAHASPSGLGVDLYCTNMIMRRQGGSLEFSGRPGQGAVFTLVLPAAEGKDDG
ncbi:MAG: ATP-binding protein [Arenibacterium sp.]